MWQPNEVDMAAVDKWSMKDISPPNNTVVEAKVKNMYYSPYLSLLRPEDAEAIIAAGDNYERYLMRTMNDSTPKQKPPMRSTEITKENLRVGDVIEEDGSVDTACVMEIMPNTFMRSMWGNHGIYGYWYSYEEARKRGWRIKLPASEQPKQQLTHKQIEEKLGYEIEIIKEV